uniref:C2H2-type domain-containing protein n=1 Tax=Clytia hemisphaerica TaxID=252671 RepID=A0A7M5UJP0_9CNID
MDKEIKIKIEEEDFSYDGAEFTETINIKIETDSIGCNNEQGNNEQSDTAVSHGTGMQLEEIPVQLDTFDSIKVKIETNDFDVFDQTIDTNVQSSSKIDPVETKTESNLGTIENELSLDLNKAASTCLNSEGSMSKAKLEEDNDSYFDVSRSADMDESIEHDTDNPELNIKIEKDCVYISQIAKPNENRNNKDTNSNGINATRNQPNPSLQDKRIGAVKVITGNQRPGSSSNRFTAVASISPFIDKLNQTLVASPSIPALIPITSSIIPKRKRNEIYDTLDSDKNQTRTVFYEEKEKEFGCTKCGRYFASKQKLSTHIRISHKHSKAFQCQECGKCFEWKAHLNKHLKKHASQKEKFLLKLKGESHSNDKVPCHICNKFYSKHNLQRHINNKHSTTTQFKCKKCEETFPVKSALNKHLKTHGDNLYECDKCNESFKFKTELHSHKVTVHNASTYAYKCGECGAHFETKDELSFHFIIHQGAQKYQCDKCCRYFGSEIELKFHADEHMTWSIPLPCEACGKEFTEKFDFENHKKFSKCRTFECAQCNNFFATKLELKNHQREHDVIETQSSSKKQSYYPKEGFSEDVYLGVMSVTKPFKCNVCGERFSQEEKLRTHKRTHLKQN